MKYRFIKNLLSLFLCFCLSLPAHATALLPEGQSANSPTLLPAEFGWIEDSRPGKVNKTVYLIKDAHASIEAQQNIANLISHFVQSHNIRTVYEEGYQGTVPSDFFFGFIQNRVHKKRVTQYLLQKLRIGGAEYAHINRDADFRLIGADDVGLHMKCLYWYRRAKIFQNEISGDLRRIQQAIDLIIRQKFPREFGLWLHEKQKFDSGSINLESYLHRWLMLSRETVQKEAVRSLHEALQLIANTPLNERDSWKKMKGLIDEVRKTEKVWLDIFLAGSEEKEIYAYYRSLQMLQKLNMLELHFEDYQKLLRGSVFKTLQAAEFLSRFSDEPKVFSKKWEKYLKSAKRFYEFAKKREVAVTVSLQQFKTTEEESTVLVYGGFHEEGIRKILTDEGFAFEIIVPAMNSFSEQEDGNYKSAMRGHIDSAPPERIFETALLQGGPAVLSEVRQWEQFASLHPDLSVLLWDRVSSEEARYRSVTGVQNQGFEALVSKGRSESREKADAEGLMIGIPVMDAGAEMIDGKIVYRNSLKKINYVLPELTDFWGMKEIYLNGGLFEMPGDQASGTGINRQLHQVEYSEEPRFLRSADGRVTIAISGYDTKRETLGDFDFGDQHGNPFSSTRRLNPHLSDSAESAGTYEKTEADLRILIENAHERSINVIVDFVPWLAPDVINQSNIDQTFSRRLAKEDLDRYRLLDEEAKQRFIEELIRRDVTFFAVRIGEGDQEEVVLVKHLMSDFGTPNVDEAILNLFHPQAQRDYVDFLKGLIDLDIDGVRIDLGHVLLRKNLAGYLAAFAIPLPDYEPWEKIIEPVKAYAASKGKSFKFIMEVYDDGDRELLQSLGADVYYNHVFSDLYRLGKRDPWVKAWGLEGSLRAALKNHGYIIYPSNYDQTPLAHFHLSPAAILMLFSVIAEGRGHAGLRSFIAWRDALGMTGDVIPIPGGDRVKSVPNLDAESAHPHVQKLEELEIRTDIEKLREAIPLSPLAFVQKDLQLLRREGKPVAETIDFTDNANRNRFFTLSWEIEGPKENKWALVAIDPYGQSPAQKLDFIELPHHLVEKHDPNNLEVVDVETGEIFPVKIIQIGGDRYVRVENIEFDPLKSYRTFIIQQKRGEVNRSESREELLSAADIKQIVSRVEKNGLLLINASEAAQLSESDRMVLLKMMLEHVKTSQWVIYNDDGQMLPDKFWSSVRKLPNVFTGSFTAEQALTKFERNGNFVVHISKGLNGKDPRSDFTHPQQTGLKFARILDQPDMIALALLYAQNGGAIPGVAEEDDFLIVQKDLLDSIHMHYLADLVISWSA